jgi:hypothetical protein
MTSSNLLPLFAALAITACSDDKQETDTIAVGPTSVDAQLTGYDTYECRSYSKGRDGSELRLVKTPSNKPALAQDSWEASYMQSGISKATKSEWGASDGGSFALTWTPEGLDERKAYLSFGDIPDENGVQPLSVAIEIGGKGKMTFDECSVPALREPNLREVR